MLQGGPEKLLYIETLDSFVVNSNFCEPLTTVPTQWAKSPKVLVNTQ